MGEAEICDTKKPTASTELKTIIRATSLNVTKFGSWMVVITTSISSDKHGLRRTIVLNAKLTITPLPVQLVYCLFRYKFLPETTKIVESIR